MVLAGADVGGTNVVVGLVDDGRDVVARAKHDTPRSVGELVDLVATMVEDLPERPDALGIGVPGIIHDGRVVQAPNLEGWDRSTDVVGALRERLGMPVALVNDAQCGLVGEWVAGAGQGTRFLFGVWLGTGVGAGMVLDGRPYDGAGGGSGEFGHVVVRPDGARCGCGRRGCVEAYAGRRMMTESVRAIAATGRPTRLFQIQAEKAKAQATSGVWAAAVAEGDPVAREVLADAVAALGIGVAGVWNLLDLERVVIGGGMAGKLGPYLAEGIAAAARPHAVRPIAADQVVAGVLGDDAGIVGASEVVRAPGRLPA